MINVVSFAMDNELMKMFVTSSHDDLDDIVQVSNNVFTLEQKPLPDQETDLLKNDFELVDEWGTRRLRCPVIEHFSGFFSLSNIMKYLCKISNIVDAVTLYSKKLAHQHLYNTPSKSSFQSVT